ncbi:MAG: hypothetical protein RL684_2568, partial [Pseudomonadota bacterium]
MKTLATVALLLVGGAAAAEDNVRAGREIFRQQCAICHSAEPNDGGGAQGPGLAGVFGRRAATVPGFAYTKELRASGLAWDAVTLDRFLRAPFSLVPGTAMAVALPSQPDRTRLIAYLRAESLAAAARPEAARPEAAQTAQAPQGAAAASAQADAGSWHNDAPGRVHRIAVDALPA